MPRPSLRGQPLPALACALWLLLALAWRASAQPGPAPDPNPTTPPAGYLFIDCGPAEGSTGGVSYTINGTNVSYAVPMDHTRTASISSSYAALTPPELTLRVFPAADLGCYWLPIHNAGLWSVRLGFAYYNYDGNNTFPRFQVIIGDFVTDDIDLQEWESPDQYAPADASPLGEEPGRAHYTEYVRNVSDPTLKVCLKSSDGETAPVLNTLELYPYDAAALPAISAVYVPEDVPWLLALKHRIKLGGGPDITPEMDTLGRRWQPAHRSNLFSILNSTGQWAPEYSNLTLPDFQLMQIKGFLPNSPDPELPHELFRTAAQGGAIPGGAQILGVTMVYRPLDPLHYLFARLFFMELNETVASGQRVFNITFGAARNDTSTTTYLEVHWDPNAYAYDFDIYGGITGFSSQPASRSELPMVGYYITQVGCHPQPQGAGEQTKLVLFLQGAPSKLPPLLSGIELYEIVANNQVLAPCQPLSQQSDADPSSLTYPGPEYPSRFSMWAIAGISMAVATGVLVVGALVVVLCRRWRESRQTKFHRFRTESSGLRWHSKRTAFAHAGTAELEPM